MKLIQSLAPAILQGATIRLTLSAASADKLQLDILPAGKENKAGIVLPPKSLIGTAAELDAGLELFMESYGSALNSVSLIARDTENEMKQIEADAQAQSKAALEAKRTNKSATPARSTTAKPPRDLNAGLKGGDDDEDDAAGGGSSTGTTLDTAEPAAGQPASVPAPAPAPSSAPAAGGLTADMF